MTDLTPEQLAEGRRLHDVAQEAFENRSDAESWFAWEAWRDEHVLALIDAAEVSADRAECLQDALEEARRYAKTMEVATAEIERQAKRIARERLQHHHPQHTQSRVLAESLEGFI